MNSNNSSHCWQCGGKLTSFGRQLPGVMVVPPGGGPPVKVHKVCAENMKKADPDFALSNVKRDVRRYLGDKS